jgi:hypothetical protein
VRKLAGAYANRYLRTLRQNLKSASGMPARSACKPAGGHVNPLAGAGGLAGGGRIPL